MLPHIHAPTCRIQLHVRQVWIQPGAGLADDYLAALESVTSSSEATMTLILLVFAIAHSGLAGRRPYGRCPWGVGGGK